MKKDIAIPEFFRNSLVLAFLLLGLIVSFNWLVNPYLLFNPPTIKGVNEVATENFFKQLLFKPYQLHEIRPRSVIIGTSHAGIAFNPDLLPPPAFNLAVGGSSSYINYRLIQEALQANPALEQLILETPLFAFNALDPNNLPGHNPEFERRLSVTTNHQRNLFRIGHVTSDHLAALISWESTRSSFRMMKKQGRVKSGKRGSFIQYKNGQWSQQQAPHTSTRQYFENSWKKFLHDEWFPAPHYSFTLVANGKSPGLDYFQRSLALLYQNGVNTTITIAPMHASLLVALQESGLWNTYEEWKRELVHINQQEALNAKREPFMIADYTRLNAYTTLALPADPKSTQRLPWFNDSAHASENFGSLILTDIQQGTIELGQTLTPESIEIYLAEQRLAVQQYADQHPEQRKIIRGLIEGSPAHRQSGMPL
jgi:hypothetical protein